MDVRIASTAKPASCLPTEIVPLLNSQTARRTEAALKARCGTEEEASPSAAFGFYEQ